MFMEMVSALAAETAACGGAATAEPAAQIHRRIAQELVYPAYSVWRGETGIAHVEFHLDDEGRPVRLRLSRRTMWRNLNRAALDTVRRIGPIACGSTATRYVAVLQYDDATPATVGQKDEELAAEAIHLRSALARERARASVQTASR